AVGVTPLRDEDEVDQGRPQKQKEQDPIGPVAVEEQRNPDDDHVENAQEDSLDELSQFHHSFLDLARSRFPLERLQGESARRAFYMLSLMVWTIISTAFSMASLGADCWLITSSMASLQAVHTEFIAGMAGMGVASAAASITPRISGSSLMISAAGRKAVGRGSPS